MSAYYQKLLLGTGCSHGRLLFLLLVYQTSTHKESSEHSHSRVYLQAQTQRLVCLQPVALEGLYLQISVEVERTWHEENEVLRKYLNLLHTWCTCNHTKDTHIVFEHRQRPSGFLLPLTCAGCKKGILLATES